MRNREIEKLITEVYNSLFKKIFTKNNVNNLMKGKKESIDKMIKSIESSKQYDDFCKEFSKKLSAKGVKRQRAMWKKYFKIAKSRGWIAITDRYTDFEIKVMKEAIKHNFKMIKTIPQEILKLTEHKYISTLIEQVAKNNLGRGSFYHQLKQHGAKNAGVIARTETAKLQTAITEQRSLELGSIAYLWRSSHDSRTRKSHKEMNDVVVFWRKNDEEKPNLDKMFGNAGEFPNCRCNPYPIFDESDLTKSVYKVYNYKTKKLITMRKSELISALNKGSL